MKWIVFLLEEPSTKEMLRGILPQLVTPDIQTQFIVFEGKQDLEKRLVHARTMIEPWRLPLLFRVEQAGESLSANHNPKRERGASAGAGLILVHASGCEQRSPG